MKTFVISLLLACVCCGVFADSDNSANELERVSLQLKWRHQFQFAGYYAAIEKGFYREVGLEVELIEGKPGLDIAETVVSGRATYGVDMPGLLIRRQEGLDVVVMAAIFQHSPLVLLLREDSGIKTPQGLRGKKVMMRQTSEAELYALFLSQGVLLDNMNIVEHNWDYESLVDGKVDAISTYMTDQPFDLRERGIEYILINPNTYGINFYGDCLFTSEDEIKRNPERVKAFRQASMRGWEYAMANPDEIIELLVNKYKSEKTAEHLKYEASMMRELIFPDVVEMGQMSNVRWQRIADTYIQLGMLDDGCSLEGFIYDPDAEQQSHVLLWMMFGFIVIVCVSLTAVTILYIFNSRLRKAVENRTKLLQQRSDELRSSEERFALAMQGANDGLWDRDMLTDKVYLSPRWKSMLGYEDNEIGNNLEESLELFHPADRGRVIKQIDKYLSGQIDVYENEFRMRHKDGHYVDILSRGSSVCDDSGKPIRFVGTHTDITEAKQMQEREREHQAELIHIARLSNIGEMASAMAHELSQPLAAITAYAGAALRILRRCDNDFCVRAVDSIEQTVKQSRRAAGILGRMRHFSRKQPPHKSDIDISEVAHEAIQFIMHEIKRNSITLIEKMDSDCPRIHADPIQIEQVILNLIKNAIDSMVGQKPEDSKLTVVTGVNADGKIEVAICDTGSGLEDNIGEKVFDSFFTTKRGGLGIGLSLSRTIVEAHNGKLWARVNEGRGVTFRFTLPVEREI
jgi:two-component system cell cycle sensor histidine kinase/response regulator CckA